MSSPGGPKERCVAIRLQQREQPQGLARYPCNQHINGEYQIAPSFVTTARISLPWKLRGPFENFVDWRQCAAVMQREEVTVMPSCSGVIISITVVLKEPFLRWWSNPSARLKSGNGSVEPH